VRHILFRLRGRKGNGGEDSATNPFSPFLTGRRWRQPDEGLRQTSDSGDETT
jgi:hypothetical protein